MNLVFTVFLLLTSGFAFSSPASDITITLREVPITQKSHDSIQEIHNPDPGTVIAWGQQLVALGESLYTLVQKGRPSITIERATPVSVLPREASTRNYVEVMDLEDATDPIKRRFIMSAKNAYGIEVVKVQFLLAYQVARYNGKGRYIINAAIFPTVTLGYGFDFSSDMRLVGVSNKGKKDDPLTVAVLNLHYRFGSFLKFKEANDAITIRGDGTVTLN